MTSKKTGKLIWLITVAGAIIILSILFFLSAPRKPDYKVFYIPFEVMTYGAIEPVQIEERAFFIFKLSSPYIDKLFSEIKSDNANDIVQESDLNIRTKIVRLKDRKVVYIAFSREVVSSGKIYLVNKDNLDMTIKAVENKSKNEECLLPDKFMCPER